MIVVNFKTYLTATGERAVELCKICKVVSEETGVRIVAVPQIGDLKSCATTGAECWSQHVDAAEPKKNTGWLTIEGVMAQGGTGTLLNHSEHKVEDEILEETRGRISGFNFEVCICANNLDEAKKAASLEPNFVAYEPAEYIGSVDKSVATEKPEVIGQVVSAIKVPVLIGAGVHSGDDVKVGLGLGAKGILLATDIVLSENPERELRELAMAFRM